MGLETENNGNESGQFGGWPGEGQPQQQGGGQQSHGQVPDILASLFGFNSFTADNRNLNIVSDVYKILKEDIFSSVKSSTTDERQRKIIPTVEQLTQSLSPNLPGLGLWVVIDGTMYLMAALFSNKELNIGAENITVNNNGNHQRVSIPLTPSAQMNDQFINKLKEHYTQTMAAKGASSLELINLVVQDMEMLNHDQSGDHKEWPANIARFFASQWEEALLVWAAKHFVAKGHTLPTPWLEPKTPYGKDGAAEARVNAISGRLTRGKTLSPANMEVITTTMNVNNNNQNYTFNQPNSRGICRVSATVSLAGVPYTEWSQQMQLQMQTQDQMSVLKQFMAANMGGGNSIWPSTYRPLRPEITIDTVIADEMLRNNGGIYPFFFGLYTLMTSNNHFVWAEALRKQQVGGRGSLVGLETRIKMVANGVPNVAQLFDPKSNLRVALNSKNVNDVDFVTHWIRQNVSPFAIFRVNLIPNGVDSPIVNFLRDLMGANAMANTKVVVSLIDAMTNNKFSEILKENRATKSGWYPDPQKPILINTNTIAVNGLAKSVIASGDGKERYINTQEVDEMFICNAKPGESASSIAGIDNYFATWYGTNPNENPKQRAQNLRTEHTSSLFDGHNHINGFGPSAVFDPGFMAAMATAMDTIGSLNAANNLGSFRIQKLAATAGIGLATLVGAGSNGVNLNNQTYNLNAPLF